MKDETKKEDIAVVYEVKATGYEVRCPYCGEISDGYYSKPIGKDNCDFCGKDFIVSEEADIEEHI